MAVEPIDTEYNGYKFRSRLEARWAIFFDELQIPYAYEPEGFNLTGVRYLPDFHLTNNIVLHQFKRPQPTEIWIEVKHSPDLTDDEREKIAKFVKQTDHQILLIAGQPDLNVTLRFIDHHPTEGWFVKDVRWIELDNKEIGLVPIEKLNDSQISAQTETYRLREAYKMAKQARFEHGENEANLRTRVKCQTCGKMFFTKHTHYYLCSQCYYNRQKELSTSPSNPPTSVKKKQKKQNRSKILVPIAIFVILGFCIGILALSTLQNSNALFPFFSTEKNLPTLEPTAIPIPTNTPFATPAPSQTPVCECRQNAYNCSEFATQSEAQACYDFCFPDFGDIHFLDNNEDKIACESLP